MGIVICNERVGECETINCTKLNTVENDHLNHFNVKAAVIYKTNARFHSAFTL